MTAAALWAPWLIGPLAWALHQNASFSLIGTICESGGILLLFLISLATLALAAAGGYLAWRNLKAARTSQWRRFMAWIGLAVSGLSFAGICIESLPVLFLDPCSGAT